MSSCKPHTLLVAIYVFCLFAEGYGQFTIPDILVQAINPRGILVSVPDNQMRQFGFHGQINDDRSIDGDATKYKESIWIYEDNNVELKVGDVIKYWVFAQYNNLGYRKDGLTFTVEKLVSRQDAYKCTDSNIPGPLGPPGEICLPTATVINNGKACGGKVIFEDNFNELDYTRWIIEQKLADDKQEGAFVSYQPSAVSIENSRLKITPEFRNQESNTFYGTLTNGTLDLRLGCTSTNSDHCYKQSIGFQIIPPIISGRISSKNSFSFKYGRIDIKAKFPLGDWIYPELLLMPTRSAYGSDGYESGVIRIAFARGNRFKSTSEGDMNNRVLNGGVLLDQTCRRDGIVTKPYYQPWGQAEHVYSLVWEPDKLTFYVDNGVYGEIIPPNEGFKRYLNYTECDGNKGSRWANGLPIAPFDKQFHIVLGIGVGGVADFPDDMPGKPWENTSPKAMNNFRKNPEWNQTWGDTNKLLVDSIKVTAL